ncbi:MAG: glucose-6-phosphate isomerase, partial [Firmicutes bacterium]|nr:glucose-6-phosphate isomerase [Bacillota bacterium]
ENKGIFPSSAMFSSDLHSIGQFIQEGSKILFETILFSENFPKDIKISSNHNDELLRNKSFNEINLKILEGSSLAHYEGGVPCLILKFKEFKEFELGKLIFFFEKSCALSALILGVNPFNQPGVEAYKKNTIKLLG